MKSNLDRNVWNRSVGKDLALDGEFAPAINLVVEQQFGSCFHRGSRSGDTTVIFHFLLGRPIPHSMERFAVVVRANCSTVNTPVFWFSLALDLVPLDTQENIFECRVSIAQKILKNT